jgi:hypothetical protein
MTPDHDSSHYIEDTLLLKFLITRYTEMLEIKEPSLVPVWSGLGLVALHQNKELRNAFETLVSPDLYTPQEALISSIDLFWAEMQRVEATDTTEYVPKKIERPPLSRKTGRRFLFWSWAEGRKMSKEKDFRFYPVWELVSWLGLNADEYINEFEKRCRFSQSSLEKRLDDGLEIIKAAIFKRSIADAFFSE